MFWEAILLQKKVTAPYKSLQFHRQSSTDTEGTILSISSLLI